MGCDNDIGIYSGFSCVYSKIVNKFFVLIRTGLYPRVATNMLCFLLVVFGCGNTGEYDPGCIVGNVYFIYS